MTKCDCCGYESDNENEFGKDELGLVWCFKYCVSDDTKLYLHINEVE